MNPPPLLFFFSLAVPDLLPIEFDKTPFAFYQHFSGEVISSVDGSLDDGLRFSFLNTAEKSGTN
ncbi:unnamed protein product [Prunus armeniaca]|uniref:Uncharacterized protein n=1 Tax=Prunus armeniaca TaxID=36596 RepID=A0A6J5WLK9_PRUAR|nr:unnamed protein product [Prunus armeniaca]